MKTHLRDLSTGNICILYLNTSAYHPAFNISSLIRKQEQIKYQKKQLLNYIKCIEV